MFVSKSWRIDTNEKEIIKNLIYDYVNNYARTHDIETRWEKPVVGVADANDPLYEELKTIISPTHALPSDIVPGAKSVIVFFVPFVKEIVISNIPEEESSREWDYAYIETNQMLGDLTGYLYEKIAEKGCCGRVASVITDWELLPDFRPKEEYCLYKAKGICGKCISRCVNNAFCIKEGKVIFDRFKCNEQIYEKIIPQWPIGLGDTCGKCMCGIPCSFVNPNEKSVRKTAI